MLDARQLGQLRRQPEMRLRKVADQRFRPLTPVARQALEPQQ
jgi:hypothetical protein